MAYQLQPLSIDPDRLTRAINQLLSVDRARFRRLWAYYQNQMRPLDAIGDNKPYRQAQEWGLPARITGYRSSSDVTASQRVEDVSRKEVVIENDIAWRADAMVEYLFGKPLILASAAPDANRRAVLTDLLRQIIAGNGGMIFLQQIALLASVYGFIDVLVKLDVTKLKDLPQDTAADPASCGETQTLGRPPTDVTDDGVQASTRMESGAHAELRTPSEAHGASQNDGLPTHDSSNSPLDAASASDSPPVPQGSAPVAAAVADSPSTSAGTTASPSLDRSPANPVPNLANFARLIRFETIEPARALPLLAANDFRIVEAYGQVYDLPCATSSSSSAETESSWLDRLYRSTVQRLRPPLISFSGAGVRTVQVIELLTATDWQRYEDGQLVTSGKNSLGQIPLVHIQNIALPFDYAGASDVEPLIPLQDELNTRLSDRAHRITMQSFKMYLGKGIDNFTDMPVAPGRMWATDNTDAQVIEFGGDAANPSEESHIGEVREALDKTSGVSPIASGNVKDKVGHLTSAAAAGCVKPYRLKPRRRSKVKPAPASDAQAVPDSRRIFPLQSPEWN